MLSRSVYGQAIMVLAPASRWALTCGGMYHAYLVDGSWQFGGSKNELREDEQGDGEQVHQDDLRRRHQRAVRFVK